MELLATDHSVNMSDLSFVKLCEAQYGINRGIYNTVDSWLFEKGVHHIVSRRKMILHFFVFLASQCETKVKKDGIRIKTGRGRLSGSLEDYWNSVHK